MRIIIILLSLFSTCFLTQCASYDFARRVRQQGNLIPQEQVNCLKVGMTKEDVAILMGSSLICPTFNNDRWDYAYTLRVGTGPLEVCRLRLFFKGNTLVQIKHNEEE